MLGAVLGLSLLAAADPASAGWGGAQAAGGGRLTLGSALTRVAHAYPQARARLTDAGEPVLELADQSYGGSRWSTVDFVFDRAGRLERVRMSTRAMTFAQLRAQLQTRYDSYLANAQALGVSGPADDDLQLRICDSGDGAVSLTYEKTTTAL